MKHEFITGIWLARFEKLSDLSVYVNWHYPDNEDEPFCSFAKDIGLDQFDSSFLETIFIPDPASFMEQIVDLSYSENFISELTEALSKTDMPTKNSLIALSGKKDNNGGVNEELFGFSPAGTNDHDLHFIGFFHYMV